MYPFNEMIKENHLLIAGCTGSGKSTLINGLIVELTHFNPNQTQFILIDPKMLDLIEFKKYKNCIMYADTIPAINKALNYALNLLKLRMTYCQLMNIKQYTGSHIYIVIDEYADLIIQDKKNIQPKIIRLIQLGRALNIHIWLATQRPTADIVNGAIKCNLDTRIPLKTACKRDLINILGYDPKLEIPLYHCLYNGKIIKIPMISTSGIKNDLLNSIIRGLKL